MKHFLLIFGTTILLFIVGLLSGSFILELTEKILNVDIVEVPATAFTPHISFGLLLAFCSIGAGGILLAYSRASSKYNPIVVFSLSLFISLLIAANEIILKLLEDREFLGDVINFHLTSNDINYFSWRFFSVLPIYIFVIAGLLVISYQKEKK